MTRRLPSRQVVCVDACLAAQWIIPEPLSIQALALYEDSRQADFDLVGALLLPFEVTGAVYKRCWRTIPPSGLLALSEAQALLRDFSTFRISLRTYPGIHADALALAYHFGLKHSHDAHYLALARHLACDLWTADQRLWNAVRTHAT